MVRKYLAYRHEDDGWDMNRFHFHNQFEVLLCLSEEARMFVSNRQYHLRPGSVLLLPDSVLHRSVAHPGQTYQRLVLRFSESYLRSITSMADMLLSMFSPECTQLQLDCWQTQALIALYKDCMTDYTGFGAELHHQLALLKLLLYLGEHSQYAQNTPASTHNPGILGEILSYISEHLTGDLSLDALSAHFYISKAQLGRIFKAETGFAPGEYIISLRIMKAKALLLEGYSVREAMHGSGFQSYAHFIRTFHTVVGQTPGRYRSNPSSEEIPDN